MPRRHDALPHSVLSKSAAVAIHPTGVATTLVHRFVVDWAGISDLRPIHRLEPAKREMDHM